MVLPFGLSTGNTQHTTTNKTTTTNNDTNTQKGNADEDAAPYNHHHHQHPIIQKPTAPTWISPPPPAQSYYATAAGYRFHGNITSGGVGGGGITIIPSPHIDFIVVNGDDRYMIRCERKAILENSVELAKLIHAGPNSGRKGDNHFQILNVHKHDFELLVRFLETKFIKFHDHLHILKIFELADRFNCPDLIIHCIRELDLQLTSATVLDIFHCLWFYNGLHPSNQLSTMVITQDNVNCSNATPSIMKKSKHKAIEGSIQNSNSNFHVNSENNVIPKSYPFTAEDYSVALLNNVLQLIDMHAELILTMPQITDLRFEELEMIVKRDALQLSSEYTLFSCLANWSIAECKRKNLEATVENRRRVLGPLCLMPRYALMTIDEFQKACDRIELLNITEILLVRDLIEGKKLKLLTPEHSQLLERFRTARPEFAKMPIYLSDRSNPKNYPKKMRHADKRVIDQEQNCWEKFGWNCLAIFACIFD